MPPAIETRTIIVKVSGENIGALKSMAKEMGGITREVKNMSSSMGSLKNIFQSVMGASVLGFGIRNITDMADSMQLLSSRINVLTGGTEDINKVMTDLIAISARTKTSVDATAEIFSRLTATTRDLGFSTQDAMLMAEGLQNTFRLSGATSEEATGGLIQFTQALGLGKLQGQEFRSVMLSNVTYAKLLSDALGVNRGQLQKMAEAGQLTVDKMLLPLVKNFKDLQEKGRGLGQTFEQTVTVAMNNFKKAISDLNTEFNLSGKFAKGIEWFIEKLGLIGLVVTVLALTQIPKLIIQIGVLRAAMITFAASNPFTAILTAISLGVLFLVDNLDSLINKFKDLTRWTGVLDVLIAPLQKYTEWVDGSPERRQKLSAQKEFIEGILGGLKSARLWATTREFKMTDAADNTDESLKHLQETINKLKTQLQSAQAAPKLKDVIEAQLAGINIAFNKGEISAQQYFDMLGSIRLQRINGELEQGKSNIFKLNEALAELRTQDVTRKFNDATISFTQFRTALREIEIQQLNDQLMAGTLAATEFNDKMLSLQNQTSLGWNSVNVGLTNYLLKVETLGKGVADVITRAFDRLGDNIYEMTKTGIYDFRQFTQAVLDDLGKIVMRAMIIQPLAQGILNFLPSPSAGGATGTTFAGGTPGTMTAKITPFGAGGIVNSPMPFMYGKGRMGVMGEAGPEAILPLSRGSGGELGVRATTAPVIININNQTGSEVTQTERTGPNGEKMIDVMIVSKFKEAVGSGALDKTFQQAFGIRRMGY